MRDMIIPKQQHQFDFIQNCSIDIRNQIKQNRRETTDMEVTKRHLIGKNELKTITDFIESIEFGSVSIVIQNGKIVQIEKNEKVRLDK